MTVAYLTLADFIPYGVPDATTEQAQTASRIIDSYLDRPEGLLWTAGADGLPAYMTGLTPRLSLALGAGISAGSGVTVAVPNAAMIQPGEVLIADRTINGKTEALVVSDMSATNSTLTFQTVGQSHSTGAILDAGLVLEEAGTPNGLGIISLPARPVARVMSAAVVGLYGAWISMNANMAGAGKAQIVAPFAAYLFDDLALKCYRDIIVRYLAGFQFSTLPSAVKQATANILQSMMNAPELGGNVKEFQAGGTRIERWNASIVDADTQRMLGPYRNGAAAFR